MSNQETRELQVVTEIDINKDDVTAIAVAEAERRLKLQIADYTQKANYLAKLITENKKDIVKLGNDMIVTKLKKMTDKIDKALKMTGIKGLECEVDISVSDTFNIEFKGAMDSVNSYSVSIILQDATQHRQRISIESGNIPASQKQVALCKKHQKNQELHNDLNRQILETRRQLGDIPAMERQIRATLAKNSMMKHKGGKELVEEILKQVDPNMKMLGI